MSYPPPPTFAMPIVKIVDSWEFNPIWMDWLTRLPYTGTFPTPPTAVNLTEISLLSGKEEFSTVWADWFLRVVEALSLPVTFQPAPTHTQIVEIEDNGSVSYINPLWVHWFTQLTA